MVWSPQTVGHTWIHSPGAPLQYNAYDRLVKTLFKVQLVNKKSEAVIGMCAARFIVAMRPDHLWLPRLGRGIISLADLQQKKVSGVDINCPLTYGPSRPSLVLPFCRAHVASKHRGLAYRNAQRPPETRVERPRSVSDGQHRSAQITLARKLSVVVDILFFHPRCPSLVPCFETLALFSTSSPLFSPQTGPKNRIQQKNFLLGLPGAKCVFGG